jgi:hypothetical protein
MSCKNNMNFIFGNLMLDITSTIYATNVETDMRAKLFEITGAHYNSMTYPYGLLKKAEQNLEYHTLKHAFWGFKYTENALKAMRDHQGFKLYLEDHEVDKLLFDNLANETRLWAKEICIYSQLKHGTHVDYTDFMYWQNKTPGQNGSAQKHKIQIIQEKLAKIWQNYFESYNKINEILSKPTDNTGAIIRELLQYNENMLNEKNSIFILLFPNERKSAAIFKNNGELLIKTENKPWETFNSQTGFGLTKPTHCIKIKFETNKINFE